MHKFGEFVAKHKILILTIAIVLLIPAIIGFKATKINYNILAYLPSDLDTVKGQTILQDDFGMGAFSIVLVKDMPAKDIQKLEDKYKEIDVVDKVVGIADVVGTGIPIEMIPDDVKDRVYKDGETLLLVTFSTGISDEETLSAIENTKTMTNEQALISGTSSTLLDTRNLSDSEVIIYVSIAVILCFLILQLAMDSFVAPILLLLNIGIAVLFNMGTNIFLGEISYITKAISAVLQLGVTMDFSIFLYHSYIHQKEKYSSNKDAMAHAIAETSQSVMGGALTTIAGFLALCSMNLTLGMDIGIVMAKGVLFGLICVLTVLPALLLIADKAIQKTMHKPLLPKFNHIKNFIIKHHVAMLIIFVIVMPFAIWGYNHTNVYYNVHKTLPDSLTSIQANRELRENFGMTSTNMLLVDINTPDKTVNQMLEEIDNLDGINTTIAFSKIADEVNFPEEMIPEDIKSIFKSDKYQLVLISSKYEMATENANKQVEKINEIIKKYDKNAIFAGEQALMTDLVKIADHDFNSVNAISIGVILIIMIFVLRSISLPVILTFVIEFAIFINMGIPGYTQNEVAFVTSIVIGTIQLGATIDYGILITTKYISRRKEGKDKKSSIDEALGTSIQSIATSALCFFGATFGVCLISEVELINQLCLMMSRGAIISMVVVITMLPAFLLLFDRLILKTTLGMKKTEEIKV